MKNSNYFPFERNHYFYGKLLSVDDFKMEQRYINNKRRLINRFVLGTGVVTGLYVVAVDEQTLSVEAGFALDAWGREIVVESPVVKKLEMFDGFEHVRRENSGYVYLCMEYDEQEADPVHNIAGAAGGAEEYSAYSKIKEGYRLFLTGEEPDGGVVSPAGCYLNSQVIYRGEDVCIKAEMPRFVRGDGTAELKFLVENTGRSNLAFSFDMILNHMLADGKSKLRVSFDEVLFERTGQYEISYELRAADAPGEEAVAVIDMDSVSLRLSGEALEMQEGGKIHSCIVSVDEWEAVENAYYRTSMNKILRGSYQQPVYLAKLYLVNAGSTCIIEKVDNVPFGQYAPNQTVSRATVQMLSDKVQKLSQSVWSTGAEGGGKADGGREKVQYARGETELVINGGQKGEKVFSQDIVHGLGLGKVTVVLGLCEKPGKTVYGASDIFDAGDKKKPDVRLAACVDEENGSFVIGAKVLNSTAAGKLKVSWTAIRDKEDILMEKSEKRIFIKPNLLELKVRESYHLEAACENMAEKAVVWSVKDEGGFIDDKGTYTAPNEAGVYEVMAQSVAFPEVRASIFVVVRDTNGDE